MLSTKTKKVYIAGPMTGLEDKNLDSFYEMALRLHTMGFDPINPARHDNPNVDSWAYYMKLGLIDMLQCDAVFVLPGWENSKGASMEVEIAKRLDIPVFQSVEEISLWI